MNLTFEEETLLKLFFTLIIKLSTIFLACSLIFSIKSFAVILYLIPLLFNFFS